MKTLSTRFLLFACLLISGLTACKKDAEPTPQQRLQGKWQVVTFTSTSGGLSVDFLVTAQPCQKDNYYELLSSKEVFSDEGTTKCSTSDAQRSQIGTRNLSEDGKTLTIPVAWGSTQLGALTYEVLELTNTQIRLQQVSNGVTTQMTLKKI